jgi:diacylglycerol kinase (ATP)
MRGRAADAGLEGRELLSTRPGEIAELAGRAVQDGAELLVVVGGDGTVHEAVNGVLRAGAGGNVELAVLSRGTGSDFVHSLGVPTKLDEAIAVAREGRARPIDVGHASYAVPGGSEAETYFANFGGAGISGAIAARANRTSKALGGRVSFIWATVAVFARWKSATMSVAVDGERRSGPMFEVLAMNGEFTAGGMKMAPGASPDDGLLDTILIGDVTKADFVRTFPKIYRGRHIGHPKIEQLKGREIRVEASEPLPVALDGEQPGMTPATFSIVPSAIRVRVP